MPPIATITGTETARQISAKPSSPIGGSASSFDGVAHTGPGAEVVRVRLDRLAEGDHRPAQEQARGAGTIRPLVGLAEVHAVGAELERGVDVVVDDERRAQLAEAAPRATTSSVGPLDAQLHDRRPAATARRAVSRSSTMAWTLTTPSPARRAGRGVERRERVVEVDVEAARPLRPPRASSPATPKATSASTAPSSGERSTARKQPVIALDMQPVPVIDASSGWPFAIATTRSPSETWSTGPVTDATTPSVRAASLAIPAGSPPAPIDSTPRISASTPTSVATSPAFPRSTATSTSSRIRFAVSVR